MGGEMLVWRWCYFHSEESGKHGGQRGRNKEPAQAGASGRYFYGGWDRGVFHMGDRKEKKGEVCPEKKQIDEGGGNPVDSF